MSLIDISPLRRSRTRRPPVDDAYRSWLGAHMRCTETLRTWMNAAPRDRAIAYRVYRAALEREENAARALEQAQELPAAA